MAAERLRLLFVWQKAGGAGVRVGATSSCDEQHLERNAACDVCNIRIGPDGVGN
jgi:hypothetical protein